VDFDDIYQFDEDSDWQWYALKTTLQSTYGNVILNTINPSIRPSTGDLIGVFTSRVCQMWDRESGWWNKRGSEKTRLGDPGSIALLDRTLRSGTESWFCDSLLARYVIWRNCPPPTCDDPALSPSQPAE
jgi:hypothetical protein